MAKAKLFKIASPFLILALVLSSVLVVLPKTVSASPAELHVGPGQPYATIQSAVDAAKPWGTIIVHPGTYNEAVDVNTFHLTIRSFSGDPSNTIVSAAGLYDHVFHVTASYVTISGFTITEAANFCDGGGCHCYYGVFLSGANGCRIWHNIITDNCDGIHLDNSHGNIIADNFLSGNWFSCPFVYSWDGEGYRLDSFVFTWSYRQALESTDYDNLDYLTPADGKYLLKMSEELFEISYVNELKLIVVDHPSGTQIIPDSQGNIHTLRAPYAPIAGEEEDGTDCLDKVKAKDGIYWSSNPDNKDFSEEEDLRDGIILTFAKPEDAQTAKVAVNFQTTKLVDDISITLLKLEGENRDEYLYTELDLDPSEVQAVYELLYLLQLEVWNGSEWVSEGPFFPEPGSWIARDEIKTIDVSGIEGDTIKIKLESLTGLVLIDSVGMDYGADEAVITHELSATTAVDANGIDVTAEILADDDQYLVLEQGDQAYLSFDEIAANPGYARSYIIKARGYYRGLVAAEGETQEELLGKLLTDFSSAARYFLEGYAARSGHCGIYLGWSHWNIISGNEIADNAPEHGMHLYYSHSNWILGNDIHGNYDGICLVESDDNIIVSNTCNSNSWDGIYMYNSRHNSLRDNTCNSNVNTGIHLYDTDYNDIINNTCELNGDAGIHLYESWYNRLRDNTCSWNYGEGIILEGSNYCEIWHNIITYNVPGIALLDSHYNTIADNIIRWNWVSCPFVYSWDGEEYRLDLQAFPGSPTPAQESTDYDNLDYLTPADGKYLLKISEELLETSYVNELKLIVVDHPSGTQVIPDTQGNIHTLRAPYAPVACEEEDGTECLDKVKEKDGIYWSSNLENKDFSEQEDLRDGIILTFEKPEDAQIAKVVVNFQNTQLANCIPMTLLKLGYAQLTFDPSQLPQLLAVRELLFLLHLEVWNGSEWVSEGTFFHGPGSYTDRDKIKCIDVSGIEGDTITIKLESLTGLVLIDSVGIDYSADEAVISHELSATTAVDANGIDVTAEILSDDDDYLVMEQGDYVNLSFDEIAANPGYDRSYMIKLKGYYQPLIAAEGEAQEELLDKLLTDFSYAARYFLERYAAGSGHCGIDLAASSNNIIAANEIAENFSDGIYLNADSDSNWILGNDILNNDGYGIYLSSGSGNVIRFNNIVGNGNGGVYANEYVYATYNWWGATDGPSGCGPGHGDSVSGNVEYNPWLISQGYGFADPFHRTILCFGECASLAFQFIAPGYDSGVLHTDSVQVQYGRIFISYQGPDASTHNISFFCFADSDRGSCFGYLFDYTTYSRYGIVVR